MTQSKSFLKAFFAAATTMILTIAGAVMVFACEPADYFYDEVNCCRECAGYQALDIDPMLQRAAEIRAQEASVYYSHIRPDGTNWNSVYKKVYAENLARTNGDGYDIVNLWSNSYAHSMNMYDSEFTKTGVATYTTPEGMTYICQLFGY